MFLGLRPFDGDEGIIIKIAQSVNFQSLIKAVSQDVHPPLYHLLEFLTFKALPLSEFSARLISALAGALAIYFIYLFFRKISTLKIALAVSLLSIINPVLSYHFAEARPYGLLVLLIFAQLYFFLKIMDHTTAKSEDMSDLVWFTILSVLMVFTQYISFAIFIGEVFYTLIFEGRHKINYKKIISTLTIIVVFGALWGKTFLSQMQGRMLEQSQIVNLKANIMGIFNAIYRFFAGRLFLDLDPSISKNLEFLQSSPWAFAVFALSVAVPLVLLIWGIVALYKKRRQNFWLIAIIFTPVLVGALLSGEIGPRAARYLLFLAPFGLYVIIELLERKQTTFKNVLFTIFLLIYISAFIYGFFPERKKPGADKIAEFISANAASGDQILVQGGFGGGESLVLKYYLGPRTDDYKIDDLYGNYQVGNLSEVKNKKPSDEIAKLKTADPARALWYYDFTYTFDEKTSLPFEKFPLGKDKENKELIVYKF